MKFESNAFLMNLLNRTYRRLTFILMAAFIPFTVMGQSPSDAPDESLIESMALKPQLSEAPESIRQQFAQNPLQLASTENETLLDLFDKAYASEKLLHDFKDALHQALEEPQRTDIHNTLHSDVLRPVVEARQFYYTLQGKRQRIITMYEMDQDPPSEQRTELIRMLGDTTSVAESSVESSVTIAKSMLRSISAISSQRNFSEAQINAIAQNVRAQMQAQAGDQVNEQLQVMYHNVASDALQAYLDFWGSNEGQTLDAAINSAMQEAYSKAGDRFLEMVNQG